MAGTLGLASKGREGYPRIDIDLDDIDAVIIWLCYLSEDAVKSLLTRLDLRQDDTADGCRWRLLRYHLMSKNRRVSWVPEDDEWHAPVTPAPPQPSYAVPSPPRVQLTTPAVPLIIKTIPYPQNNTYPPPPKPLSESDRARVTPEPLYPQYYQEPPRDIYNVIRKWDVKFSGKADASAAEFLVRVKEYRVVSHLSDREILLALPFLLTDIALLWYRLNKTQWHAWTDFVDAFRVRFCDMIYVIRVRDKARRRTQRRNEPIADYLVSLRTICNRVTNPWAEIDQLDLAYANLDPKYRSAISRADVHSFKALESAGRRIEEAKALDQFLTRSQKRPNPPDINSSSYVPFT